MNIGMLWYDPDFSKGNGPRVERAADYYQRKYHVAPSLALVNPKDLPDGLAAAHERPAGCIQLRPSRSIMPGHIWIGVEDGNPEKPAAG